MTIRELRTAMRGLDPDMEIMVGDHDHGLELINGSIRYVEVQNTKDFDDPAGMYETSRPYLRLQL